MLSKSFILLFLDFYWFFCLDKYQVQYGSHSHYNNNNYDDDEAFQLVDQNRNQRTGNQRGRIRVGQVLSSAFQSKSFKILTTLKNLF